MAYPLNFVKASVLQWFHLFWHSEAEHFWLLFIFYPRSGLISKEEGMAWMVSFDKYAWIKIKRLTAVVLWAALSSTDPHSGSRTGLGIAVGILAFAVVVVLAAVAIMYRRLARFWRVHAFHRAPQHQSVDGVLPLNTWWRLSALGVMVLVFDLHFKCITLYYTFEMQNERNTIAFSCYTYVLIMYFYLLWHVDMTC